MLASLDHIATQKYSSLNFPNLTHWRQWLGRWTQNWKSHLGTVLVAIVAFSAVQLWQTRNAPQGMAPDFTLLLLPAAANAASADPAPAGFVSLALWRKAHPGQAIAIHVWADWCPICRAEESSVSSVGQDWPVLTIATQSSEGPKLQRYKAQRGLDWVTALDPEGQIGRLYGLGGVPAWIVVAPDGDISSVTMGYTTELGMRVRLWWAQHF